MIHRFRQVSNNLFRGSAPSISDVHMLKNMGIKKIVSLDAISGKKIDRACKLLNIKHIMLPIDVGKKSSLIKFLQQDIHELFDTGGKTFVHCKWGKDRTSLAVAIYRCEEQRWSCARALKEAKSLGFGVGVDPDIIKLYKKIIKKSCGCRDNDKHDINSAYDIVSNEREFPYDDYIQGPGQQQSWSPYSDYRVKEYPYSNQNIDWQEQYNSRQDYGLDDTVNDTSKNYGKGFPQSGGYDNNTQGISGAGPSMVGGGFI